MKIITRIQAKYLGLVHYFTGNKCKRGHLSPRLVSNCTCCECSYLYRKENFRDLSKYISAYQKANPDKVNKRNKKYKDNNKEKVALAAKKYGIKNPEKLNFHLSKYRALKKKAYKSGFEEELKSIYKTSQELDSITGIKHHVDHLIPLSKGGLHKPDNLLPIPAYLNQAKSSKTWTLQKAKSECAKFYRENDVDVSLINGILSKIGK